MKLFHREDYLKKLRPFYDSDLIKVITGIRRCGKSCLMLTVIDELKERGVSDDHILHLNLDRRGYKSIRKPDQLEAIIASLDGVPGLKYVFIDEVQNVVGFEEVVNAFREEGDYSIFLTGSNSYLLSGELATKLTGRHVSFEMFTLNFAEYLDMKRFLDLEPISSLNAEFDSYLRFGGFPKALEFDSAEAKLTYTEDVISQIMEKDVRGRRKIRDRDRFDRVSSYVINNFGSPTSMTSIASALRSPSLPNLKSTTVKGYIETLENAEIINQCQRFDLKSRKSLRGLEKYYLSDLSIYFVRNTDARVNYGPCLENILYLYLRSKGYSLSIGKIGELECDFIARKRDSYAYIQVAMTIADPATEDREYRAFSHIRDGYPRYLFTLDPLQQNRDGVHHVNLIEFMAENRDLDL